MTDRIDLEGLEKLRAEGTPGTWSITEDEDIVCERAVTDIEDGETYTESLSIATGECSQNWGYIQWGKIEDAALIVAAVNALPELLAERDRLREAYAMATRMLLYEHKGDIYSYDIREDLDKAFACVPGGFPHRAASNQETKEADTARRRKALDELIAMDADLYDDPPETKP